MEVTAPLWRPESWTHSQGRAGGLSGIYRKCANDRRNTLSAELDVNIGSPLSDLRVSIRRAKLFCCLALGRPEQKGRQKTETKERFVTRDNGLLHNKAVFLLE